VPGRARSLPPSPPEPLPRAWQSARTAAASTSPTAGPPGYRYSTRTDKVVRTLPAGRYPVAVAAGPGGGPVYVANEVDATVSVVSAGAGTITATVPTGQDPFGVALAPGGQWVYAAILGPGDVSVISTSTGRVSAAVHVGPPGTDPFSIAVTPSAVYVTDQGADTVTIISPATLKVTATINVGNSPYGVAADV
jgi:YVTN family beta-propeller protein